MSLYPAVSTKLHQILEQAEKLTAGARGDLVDEGFEMHFSPRVSALLLDLDRQWKDIVLKEVPLEHNSDFMDDMQPEWQALQKLVKAAHPAAVRAKHDRLDASVTKEEQSAANRKAGALMSGIGPSLKEGGLRLVVDNDR